MTRVDWQYATPNMKLLSLAVQRFVNAEGLDAAYGAIIITLGDPNVSLQYVGPNRVNGADLIEYVLSIAEDLRTQPVSGDRPHP